MEINRFFAALNFHTSLVSFVSVEYFLLANDLAWFLNLILKSSVHLSARMAAEVISIQMGGGR